MCKEKTIIDKRNNSEELVPVITYVKDSPQTKVIGAWLSLLSVCHMDYQSQIRLRNVLAPEDALSCEAILEKFMGDFIKNENCQSMRQTDNYKLVYEIVRKLPETDKLFLKDRFIKICGEQCYYEFWTRFEQASGFEYCVPCDATTLQLIKVNEFCIFFIALLCFYGCSDALYERISFLENKLRFKYGISFPFDKIGLCLWPLEMTFVQNEEKGHENINEHLSLLKAIRTINPDVMVQARIDTLLWSRDIIAWLDDDYSLYVKLANNDLDYHYGKGLLNEGGNIITGTGVDKFVLIAQGAFCDDVSEVNFYHKLLMENIRVYTLPDGFIWARNPNTQTDLIIDSIHIDAVINIVPKEFTFDNRMKLIVDPYYYGVIQDSKDFKSLLEQQSISKKDIVVVDESELYLNLPNFSILLDPRGQKKLLFNKDKGYTLPRLHLKTSLLVQPDIEIAKMSCYAGSIRCATNMLPGSYVKKGANITIIFPETFSSQLKAAITGLLQNDTTIAKWLSKLFVFTITFHILSLETEWEFDEMTRTVYIYCTSFQISDSKVFSGIINQYLNEIAEKLGRRLGIAIDQ